MATIGGDRAALFEHYQSAKKWLECSPYVLEIEWQASLYLSDISESHFLREYAWVILNSGFRESVVRRHFDYISLCFCDWESAFEIDANRQACVDSALAVFAHRRKLEAIVATASVVHSAGFEQLREAVEADALQALSSLPYIGSVTIWHLAKNLGVDVAKPDRHLKRVAGRFGYDDVNRMCRDIQSDFGDRISVADIVLWRFEEQALRRGKKTTH